MNYEDTRKTTPTQSNALEALETALVSALEESPGDMEAVESELMGSLMKVGRGVLKTLLEQRCEREEFEEEGVVWKPAVSSTKRLMTSFGTIAIDRPLFRSVRNGPTRCLVSEAADVMRDMWTPRAAKLAAIATTELTFERSEDLLAELGGMNPSAASLRRLSLFLSELWEEKRSDYEQAISSAATIPEEALSFSASLDGVMVNMVASNRAEKKALARAKGKPPKGPSGYKEASVGVVTFYDEEGNRLRSRRIARMPQAKKVATKRWLEDEVARIRERRPDLVSVAIADGAEDNWTFLERLKADHEVVDYYHTASHVQRFVYRCNEASTVETQEKASELRRVLLEEKDGAEAVFTELHEMRRKAGRELKSTRKDYKGKKRTYLDLHRERMNYAELRDKNLPIGSGVTEGTCRHVVVDRLRRSGMCWGEDGGQAILTLRALRISGDFDGAWTLLRAANDARLRAA